MEAVDVRSVSVEVFQHPTSESSCFPHILCRYPDNLFENQTKQFWCHNLYFQGQATAARGEGG